MITLFGATGYTGSRIAKNLDRDGVPFRIAGRSAKKLEELSQKLSSRPACLTADVLQPSTISQMMKGTTLLINCVGPFTDLGERVLSAAAVAGVHYLDTTNELGFVFKAQTYDRLAQKSGAALVPACAFEVALADCAAELLNKQLSGSCETVEVVYHLSGGGASRGTRLSALRSLATSWMRYQNGTWSGKAPGSERKWFNLSSGRVSGLSFPSSESVTIPKHSSASQVTAYMTASPTLTWVGMLLLPFFSRFLRSLPGRLVLWVASLNPPSNADEQSDQRSFEVFIKASNPNGSKQITLVGNKAYALTAEIITYAAKVMSQPGISKRGILAPAQILAPLPFFDSASQWGVKLIPPLSVKEEQALV